MTKQDKLYHCSYHHILITCITNKSKNNALSSSTGKDFMKNSVVEQVQMLIQKDICKIQKKAYIP